MDVTYIGLKVAQKRPKRVVIVWYNKTNVESDGKQ
jgi:hypothetical protein